MTVWTQLKIAMWAKATFGDAYDPVTIAARLNKEMAELLTELAADRKGVSPQVHDEIADVGIMLFRLASVCKVDLLTAIDRKMEINEKRDWKVRGDGTGQQVKYLDSGTKS